MLGSLRVSSPNPFSQLTCNGQIGCNFVTLMCSSLPSLLKPDFVAMVEKSQECKGYFKPSLAPLLGFGNANCPRENGVSMTISHV